MNSDEKEHFLKFLEKGKRYDGRGLTDFRKIMLETNVTKTAEGSATIKIGETELIAGVKMAVEKPFSDSPDEGILMFNAEFMPIASPEFESGPPSIEAIELARVVDKSFRESNALDTKKLCIEKGEKVWSIGVDICTFNDAGNLLDAAELASLAALMTSRFPKYDGEKVDYTEKTDTMLKLEKEPVQVTVSKVGNFLIVDPTRHEEKMVDARLTVGVEKNGIICELQKGGDEPLSAEEILKMVEIAVEKSKELRKML